MSPGLETPLLTQEVVTAEWLREQLHNPALRIIDARSKEDYAEGHVPGAAHLDLAEIRTERDGVEGMLVVPEAFAQVAKRLGVGADTWVIAYDDGFGLTAARIAWSFLRFGHTRVALLAGGWDAWESSDSPVTTETPTLPTSSFQPHPLDQHFADIQYVAKNAQSPDVVLVDTRSPAEYDKGHIPGAVSWNWENGLDIERTFGNASEISAQLQAAGITPDKEIITYCQSGVRAAHTFFLLRQLGYPRVRLYDGSWLEWSQRHGKDSE